MAAAHVEVVSSSLRRAKVKVTPGTYLVDVLNEACDKLGLKSDNYLLKHKQRTLDLSGPFRTSGLVTGAKLELIQKSTSPSVVSIALDVAGHARLTKKLPSSLTLWQVLRQFESANDDTATSRPNITARGVPQVNNGANSTGAGLLYHEAPVVNVMGKEYASLQDLQKTLSQCGINTGSILLRVSFRNSGRPLHEALEQIATYMDDVDGPSRPGAATEAKKNENEPSIAVASVSDSTTEAAPTESSQVEAGSNAAAAAAAMDIDSPQPALAPVSSASPPPITAITTTQPAATSSPPVTTPPSDPLLPTSIFAAPASSTPHAAHTTEADSVYEPSVAHAQLRQQQLVERAQNTRLKSDAELAADAAERAERLARIASVALRVRFPDQTSAQWAVGREHTGAFLYRAVRAVMAHPDQPFRLTMTTATARAGPGTAAGAKATVVPDDDSRALIAELGIRGPELLHLLWEDGASEQARKSPFLNDGAANRAQAVALPEVSGGEADEEEPATREGGSSRKLGKGERGSGTGSSSKAGLDPEAMKQKLGKMFKLPGRK